MIDFESLNNARAYEALRIKEEVEVYRSKNFTLLRATDINPDEPFIENRYVLDDEDELNCDVPIFDIGSITYSIKVEDDWNVVGLEWPMVCEGDFVSFENFREFLKEGFEASFISLLKGIEKSATLPKEKVFPDGEVRKELTKYSCYKLFVEDGNLNYSCDYTHNFALCNIQIPLGKAYNSKILMLLPLITAFEKQLNRMLQFFLDFVCMVHMRQGYLEILGGDGSEIEEEEVEPSCPCDRGEAFL